MPFCMFSAAGDAMVKGGWVVGCSWGGSRSRVGEVATDAKAWRAHAAQVLAGIWGELNVTTSAFTHRGRQDEGKHTTQYLHVLKNRVSEISRDAAGKKLVSIFGCRPGTLYMKCKDRRISPRL
jgi:hypothetical protein